MTVTARSTIQGALKLAGILSPLETMSAASADDGLVMLNNLVDGWNVDRLYIYTITDVVATFSGASATIGPAMTINTVRPIRIESAFYRRSGIDYPLRIIDVDEYNSIGLKTVSGDYPEVLYYTGDSPTGAVYVWPVPSANEYHLQVMSQLTEFADLDTAYSLPQGYRKALMYSLAEELAPMYDMELSPLTLKTALAIRRSLKRANVVVPGLAYAGPQNSNNNGRINILSNQ